MAPAETTEDDLAEVSQYRAGGGGGGWKVLKALIGKRSISANSKDWRNDGAVTQVKNQLTCQSCWAFAAVGALVGLNFRTTKQLLSFSEQQVVDCSSENKGCEKSFTAKVFIHTKRHGVHIRTLLVKSRIVKLQRVHSKSQILRIWMKETKVS